MYNDKRGPKWMQGASVSVFIPCAVGNIKLEEK